MKKIPERMCVVTHEKHEKQAMLRIVKDKDGKIFVDPTGKQNGKGAYITKSSEVLALAIKNKTLEKIFASPIPDSVYEEIKNNI
jgi:uncharacterized protein